MGYTDRKHVLETEKEERAFRILCYEYGISRKTGYKWLPRDFGSPGDLFGNPVLLLSFGYPFSGFFDLTSAGPHVALQTKRE